MTEIDLTMFQRAVEGDREAYWTLILPYRGLIYSVAAGMLKDDERAKDLLHDTLIHAFKSLPNLRSPSKLPSWLYSMTRNRARDFVRREQRMRQSLFSAAKDLNEKPPQSEAIEREFRLNRMEEGIAQLPEPFRIILGLKYMNRYSCKEIAEILEITVSAVKSRLFEARKLLRKITETLSVEKKGLSHEMQ